MAGASGEGGDESAGAVVNGISASLAPVDRELEAATRVTRARVSRSTPFMSR